MKRYSVPTITLIEGEHGFTLLSSTQDMGGYIMDVFSYRSEDIE